MRWRCVIEMNDPFYCPVLFACARWGRGMTPLVFWPPEAALASAEMMMKDLVGVDGKMWINEAQIELIAMTSHNGGAA